MDRDAEIREKGKRVENKRRLRLRYNNSKIKT